VSGHEERERLEIQGKRGGEKSNGRKGRIAFSSGHPRAEKREETSSRGEGRRVTFESFSKGRGGGGKRTTEGGGKGRGQGSEREGHGARLLILL